MRGIRFRRLAALLTVTSIGTLGLFGCVTDTLFREFSQTTLIRVFWQTVGTALQSAIIDQFGSQDGA